jgi:hypothetical protein
MNTKLIIIEGLPGSGKTTIAKMINEYLVSKGIKTDLYLEDDQHPADLEWHACIPKDMYNKMLIKYPDLSKDIQTHTVWNGEQAIVAFNKISCTDKEFYDDMHQYEIYNGKIPLDEFCSLLQSRWAYFAENAAANEVVTIFEGALLQSQTNDLLAVRNCDKRVIFSHLEKLVHSVQTLNPLILYLSVENVEEIISGIASERISKDAQPNWIDMAMGYVERSVFGKAHGLKGFSGVVEFSKARKSIELEFLAASTVNCAILEGTDYDRRWEDIKTVLENH